MKLLCLFKPTFNESIEDFSQIIFHCIKLDPIFTPFVFNKTFFKCWINWFVRTWGAYYCNFFLFNNEQNNVFKQKRLNLNINIRRPISVLSVFFWNLFDFFIQVNSILYLLKYGFCNKSFRKYEPLTSWTLLSTYLSSKLDSPVIKILQRIRFSSNQNIGEGESDFDDKYVEKSV